MEPKAFRDLQRQKAGKGFTVTVVLLSGLLLVAWALSAEDLPTGWVEWLWIGGFFHILAGWAAFRKISNWVLSLAVLDMLWLMAEAILFVAIMAGGISSQKPWAALQTGVPVIPYFEGESAVFDPVSGYRWQGDSGRAVKVANGKLVFDSRFRINKQGFVSDIDYQREKADSSRKRYMVFGDSFTDGYFLKTNWPDRLRELWTERGSEAELYSFALNGGGIGNWYPVFFGEVVPHYEFDGIILAVFANDLDRDPFILHQEKGHVFFKWLETIPENEAVFRQNALPQMDSLPLIKSEAELDLMVQEAVSGGKWRFRDGPQAIIRISNRLRSFLSLRRHGRAISGMLGKYIDPPAEEIVSAETLAGKYKPAHLAGLDSLLRFCKRNGKEVILCSIPEEYGIGLVQAGKKTALQTELAFLAEEYGAGYFDGYSLFADLPEDSIRAAFLPYDGHWSQRGSDRFARGIAEWMEPRGP